jgi:hypothetical protein
MGRRRRPTWTAAEAAGQTKIVRLRISAAGSDAIRPAHRRPHRVDRIGDRKSFDAPGERLV